MIKLSMKFKLTCVVSIIFAVNFHFPMAAHAQEADSCRSVLNNSALRFQECNNTKIKRVVPISNGFIYIVLYAENLSENLWCMPANENQLLIHRDNPNIDTIYAILLNAHEKQRPIKAVRFARTANPATGTAGSCLVESVTSDL